MKRLGLIILLAMAIPFMGWSQATQQAVINSMGGGLSTGGNYSNFSVVGQIAQDSLRTDGNGVIWRTVGFLPAADDNVVVPVCNIPIGLTLVSVAETSANLEWSAEANVNYDYRYSLQGLNDWVEVLDQTISSLELTGLEAGTAYDFQLRTNCDEELVSDWTELLTFETFQFAVCDPVVDVSTDVAGQDVTVIWTLPNSDFNSLEIRVRNDGDTEWPGEGVVALQTDDVSYTYAGLAPGIYQVQIGTSCDGFDDPVYSSSVLFQIDNPCVAPELTPGAIDGQSIEITWSDVQAAGYNVRTRPKGIFDWSDPVALSGVLEYTFTGLDDGIVYEIQIQADCGSGSLSVYGSIIEVQTLGAPCEIPVNLAAANIGQTTVDLSWDATNAIFYDIRYRVKGEAPLIKSSVEDPFVTLASLIPGRTYELAVRSVCENNTPGSDYSYIMEFTMLAPDTPCLTPTVSSINIGEDGQLGNVDISWTDESAVAYEFRYRKTTSFEWNLRALLEKTIALTDLKEGVTYEYQVRSLCGPQGEITSEWTEAAFFEIPSTIVCEAPHNFLATAGGAGEIILSWDDNGASEYKVRYKVKGFPFWSPVTLDGPTSLLGLVEGEEYQVRVATVCSEDGSVWSAYTPTQTVNAGGSALVCDQPGDLEVIPSLGGVTINWNTGVDDRDYTIRYRLKGTNNWIFEDLTTNQFVSSTLQQGMTYRYQVREVCGSNVVSEWTQIDEFTTGGLPTCDIPEIANAAFETENDITIDWSNVTSALYYRVRYRVAGTLGWTNQEVVGNTLTVGPLNPGTAYQFRVQSICDAEGELRSEFSPISTFETDGLPICNVAAGINATGLDGGADITWDFNADADYYQVRYRIAGRAGWQLAVTNGNVTGLQLLDLGEGTEYEYEVRTICDGEEGVVSPYSATQTVTTLGAPCLIPIVSVDEVLGAPDLSATLSWVDDPQGAVPDDGYVYRYRIRGAIEWQEASTSINNVALTGLLPGETYQFRIRSVCDDDLRIRSPFSTITSFDVPGVSSCTKPTDLSADNISTNGAMLNWADNGSLSYDVQYRPVGTTVWANRLNVTSNSVTVSNLIAGEEYEWRVRGDCDTGASSRFSARSSFTTTSVINLVASQVRRDRVNESDLLIDDNEETNGETLVEALDEGQDQQSIARINVDLYPNPFRDRVNLVINNPNDAQVSITMFNLAGLRIMDIFDGGLSANQSYGFQIDGTNLTNGIYMIAIGGIGEQRIVRRVMLKR